MVFTQMDKRQPTTAGPGGIANTTSPGVASGAHSQSQELEEEELSLRRDARPSASLEEGPRDPSELCVGKTDDCAAEEDGNEGILQPELPPIPAVGRAPGALVTGRWLLNINIHVRNFLQ